MTNNAETQEEKWKRLIGKLPEGFFIEAVENENGTIRLHYNGRGFEKFTAKGSPHFCVGSINSLVCGNNDEVVDFIKKQVENMKRSVKSRSE